MVDYSSNGQAAGRGYPVIHSFLPLYHDGTRVSYSFKALADGMERSGATVKRYVICDATHDHRVMHLLPERLYSMTSRFLRHPSATLMRRFRRRIGYGDWVHAWIDSPVKEIKAAKAKGAFIAREMINCPLQQQSEQLQLAHALLNKPYMPASRVAIEQEMSQLLAADAVFCPNPLVHRAVLACGVAPARCLLTSYGWSEERLRPMDERAQVERNEVTFAFVGSGDVRKGLPWLLSAWAASAVNGRLLLAGNIEDSIRADYAEILAREDVVCLGYVSDIRTVYDVADVFCFPSWEEGGPMVTIEALAMGLPCIVTPMGSAGVASKATGIIVAPGSIDELVNAIRTLASDAQARSRFGLAARTAAQPFQWEHVAARRLVQLSSLASVTPP